ncbi:hypothetical protein EJB05_25867, partial [Eragrostis curvula]
MGAATKKMQLEAAVVGLLVLVVICWLPSSSEAAAQELGIYDWVTQQPAATGGGCAEKKDAALSAAERIHINNVIDPSDSDESSYKTIGESVANIPDGSTKRYVLTLMPGVVYREKVLIGKSKPFVTIRSRDPYNPAVIVWNDTAATLGKDGKPLGVDGSSTVTVESDYFIAYGVVFRNDAPSKAPAAAWTKNGEAPALRLLGTKATIYNCTIEGGQGALYDQKGLHYIKSSTIKGTVDFIFGLAKSLYHDCNIVAAVDGAAPDLPVAPQPVGSALMIKVAPGSETGFAFKTCIFQGQRIYLGRGDAPSVYSYSKMDKMIVPIILSAALDNAHVPDKGYFYALFKCHQPEIESRLNLGENIMTYAQAKPFLGTQFVSGDSWIPSLPPPDEAER